MGRLLPYLEREPKGLPRGRLDLVQRADLHLLEADLEEGAVARGPEGAALLPVEGRQHDEQVHVLLPHHLPEGGAGRLQRVLRQDELAPVEETCRRKERGMKKRCGGLASSAATFCTSMDRDGPDAVRTS